MNPVVRTMLTHVGTAAGAGAAVAAYLASGKVDLYAVWDQASQVVKDVTILVATVTPIATTIVGMVKARFPSKMADVERDPRFKGAVVSPEVAAQLGPKVQPSLQDLAQEIHAANAPLRTP